VSEEETPLLERRKKEKREGSLKRLKTLGENREKEEYFSASVRWRRNSGPCSQEGFVVREKWAILRSSRKLFGPKKITLEG